MRLRINPCPALWPDRGLEHVGSQRNAEFSETLSRLPEDWGTERWGPECQAGDCGFYPADTGVTEGFRTKELCGIVFFFPFIGSQIPLTSNMHMLMTRKRAGRIHIGDRGGKFWDGEVDKGRFPLFIQYPIWFEYFTVRICALITFTI